MESTDQLLSLLSLAFGLWAGVVAWGVRRISTQLTDISRELRRESDKLNGYIIQTEARLAVLENINRIQNEKGKV